MLRLLKYVLLTLIVVLVGGAGLVWWRTGVLDLTEVKPKRRVRISNPSEILHHEEHEEHEAFVSFVLFVVKALITTRRTSARVSP